MPALFFDLISFIKPEIKKEKPPKQLELETKTIIDVISNRLKFEWQAYLIK